MELYKEPKPYDGDTNDDDGDNAVTDGKDNAKKRLSDDKRRNVQHDESVHSITFIRIHLFSEV